MFINELIFIFTLIKNKLLGYFDRLYYKLLRLNNEIQYKIEIASRVEKE